MKLRIQIDLEDTFDGGEKDSVSVRYETEEGDGYLLGLRIGRALLVIGEYLTLDDIEGVLEGIKESLSEASDDYRPHWFACEQEKGELKKDRRL